MEDIDKNSLGDYITTIRKNNINGRVLLHCDLEELKKLMRMNFGDWEMFRVTIVSMREHEMTSFIRQDESKNVRFSVSKHSTKERKGKNACKLLHTHT